MQVYANYNGKGDCVNYKSTDYGNLNASGWDYQVIIYFIVYQNDFRIRKILNEIT